MKVKRDLGSWKALRYIEKALTERYVKGRFRVRAKKKKKQDKVCVLGAIAEYYREVDRIVDAENELADEESVMMCSDEGVKNTVLAVQRGCEKVAGIGSPVETNDHYGQATILEAVHLAAQMVKPPKRRKPKPEKAEISVGYSETPVRTPAHEEPILATTKATPTAAFKKEQQKCPISGLSS